MKTKLVFYNKKPNFKIINGAQKDLIIYNPTQFQQGVEVELHRYDYASENIKIFATYDQATNSQFIHTESVASPPTNNYISSKIERKGGSNPKINFDLFQVTQNDKVIVLGIGIEDGRIQLNSTMGITVFPLHTNNQLVFRFQNSQFEFYYCA